MRRHALFLRVVSWGTMACACVVRDARSQEPGCRNGAMPAANAYVLSNPLYSYYLGDFEQFVASNATHYRAGGDAVRCMAALSEVFLRASVRLYDPTEQRRRDEVNAELRKRGIEPGQQESSASTQLYTVGQRLARLARGLPAAVNGDWGPFQTMGGEAERLQLFGEQMLRFLLREPDSRFLMAELEPMIRELLKMDHEAILSQAAVLAQPTCTATPATGECGQLEATRALAAGDMVASKQAFLRVRNSDPSNERWPLSEAIIWYKAGKLAEAEQANRLALQISPNHFTAHDNLAFVLFDLNRVTEALTHWDAALAIRPEDPDALAGKAIAFRSLGRTAEAVELYRRAVRGDSSYLDCEVMRKQFLWSTIACETAAPLIRQVR